MEEKEITQNYLEQSNIDQIDENKENLDKNEIETNQSLENISQESQEESQVADAEKELSEDEQSYREFVDSLPAKWYVLHTFSGYENVAKDNLETVVEKFNLQDRIFDIVIPMGDVVEEKNGKKKLVQRKAMPCYILVKMKYADDLWHNVTRTRGITGFVGPKGRPLALTEDEVVKLRLEKITVDVDLQEGDRVEIIEGALDGMVGQIKSINLETGIASVNVEMFGRETSVDLNLSQLRKINS